MDESPNRHGLLDVGGGQLVHWDEWGSPDGVPALYVHGGPGGTLGTSAYRKKFDLRRTRLVGFVEQWRAANETLVSALSA